MEQTKLSQPYTELQEIAVRQLTNAIRDDKSSPERITALAGALKTAVECAGNDFNFRHFVNNQGMMMQAQMAQAMRAQQEPPARN